MDITNIDRLIEVYSPGEDVNNDLKVKVHVQFQSLNLY